MRMSWPRRIEIVTLLTLAVLLVSEVTLTVPGASDAPTVSVSLGRSGGVEQVSSTISASVTTDFVQTSLWVPAGIPALSVHYYYDVAYPPGPYASDDWSAMAAHLRNVAEVRGLALSLEVDNATQLANYLSGPTSPDGQVVIIASGVLPYTVFHQGFSLLSNWVKRGGTLVWIGPLIGAYALTPGETVGCHTTVVANGTQQFVNLSLFQGSIPAGACNAKPAIPPVIAFLNATSLSAALGDTFRLSYPGTMLNDKSVMAAGGTDLGNHFEGFTDAALLPLGLGRLLYFSGPPSESDSMVMSILNLLQTGVITASATVLESQSVHVSAGQTQRSQTSVPLPSAAASEPAGEFCVLTFVSDYMSPFASQTCD